MGGKLSDGNSYLGFAACLVPCALDHPWEGFSTGTAFGSNPYKHGSCHVSWPLAALGTSFWRLLELAGRLGQGFSSRGRVLTGRLRHALGVGLDRPENFFRLAAETGCRLIKQHLLGVGSHGSEFGRGSGRHRSIELRAGWHWCHAALHCWRDSWTHRSFQVCRDWRGLCLYQAKASRLCWLFAGSSLFGQRQRFIIWVLPRRSCMWKPAGGQVGNAFANHSQLFDGHCWPHHSQKQRPIDQSDIPDGKEFLKYRLSAMRSLISSLDPRDLLWGYCGFTNG